ncbi:hypothetical protein [Erwinia tasmaniensis]|uniref:Uncharacterized protein n=1 Tax=Erwinia tasmaniensis (strain DSM 17950 / CFBP 7177 / CIP 109463 / NCPPB 4357 / Et1/99) TaxID=465817 RepID=B2VIU7_ERWT9|nr:hypothetical protein [Erwinia tasmaniensis]CAO96244.1 Hypothetical protein ETA_11980 [Erwinia tasmaniensis Et1/99]
MRYKISESTSHPTVPSMNRVSDCSHNRKIAQSRRHGFSAHVFSVSRSTNEMPAFPGRGHRWHPLRQQGLNRPGRSLSRRPPETPTEVDAQLKEVGEKAGELQRLADDPSQATRKAQSELIPVFKLRGKSGLLTGVALVTLGMGAFVCSRYPFGAESKGRPSARLKQLLFASPVGADTTVMQTEPLPVAAGIWAAKTANVSDVTQSSDVKVEKLDSSCLMQRETLSLADIFRQIGNTMMNPVAELAKESQVIDYYHSLGRCPDDEDIKFLSEVTGKVDRIVSALISLSPEMTPFVIIQRVGGALFRMLADQMGGKPVDFSDVQTVNDQAMMMAKMITDFSPKDENGQLSDSESLLPENTYL